MSEDMRIPPQSQDHQPGIQAEMEPRPESEAKSYLAAGKLRGKAALITGGDSGIGRAVAVAFAKEGADVAVLHLAEEEEDARETRRLIEAEGRRCLLMAGDVGEDDFCREAVERTLSELGRLDVLVSNAAEQHQATDIAQIQPEQVERTFRTNVFAAFYLARHATPKMKNGSSIIVSTSVTAFRGSSHLVDYAATKGALLAFVRSLSQQLVERGIRVNGVAPGPIWTPLIPASFEPDQVEKFGRDTPMKRPGQPDEVAPSYVFLASEDASYMTGQVLHPNGGEIVA